MKKDAARLAFVAGHYAMTRETHLMPSPGAANDDFDRWWSQHKQSFDNAAARRPAKRNEEKK